MSSTPDTEVESGQHPHYGPVSIPKGTKREDEINDDLPRVPEGFRLTGTPEYVDPMSHMSDISLDAGNARLYVRGPFGVAATSFGPKPKSVKYQHKFWRDAAYANVMLAATRSAPLNLMWNFLKEAYVDQGQLDLPNPKVPWANDGEKVGRTAHEQFAEDYQTDPVAQKLHKKFGWQLPTYFGAVDTTPLMAMLTAREAKTNPLPLLDLVTQKNNSGKERTVTVLEAYLDGLHYVINECAITDENPHGIYITADMSNQTKGDWDDSPQGMRTKDGRVLHGKTGHVQLQMYCRSSLMGLDDVRTSMADAFARGEVTTEEFQTFNRTLSLHGFGDNGRQMLAARETAKRLAEKTEELFLVHDDPDWGTFFALGIDQSTAAQITKYDALGAKAAMMLLVEPEHLPADFLEIIVHQVMDPKNGLVVPTGIRNMSGQDSLFNVDTYHDAIWPHIVGLLQYGLRLHGLHGLANEVAERNLLNFIDPAVLGSHEFLAATAEERPVIIVRKIMAVIESREPPFAFATVQPGEAAQLWSHQAAILALEQVVDAWEGKLPARAHDELKQRLEAVTLVDLHEAQPLRTLGLFKQDDEAFWEDATTRASEERIGKDGTKYTLVTSITEGTSVTLYGQRVPGQKDLHHEAVDFSLA